MRKRINQRGMCVCERERGGGGRESNTDRERASLYLQMAIGTGLQRVIGVEVLVWDSSSGR